jgi:transcriptional regulator
VQPEGGHTDPAAHRRQLNGIRGVRLVIDDVQAKFKYGGNVDAAHRLAVADHLSRRNGPGDAAARAQLMRRLDRETPCL